MRPSLDNCHFEPVTQFVHHTALFDLLISHRSIGILSKSLRKVHQDLGNGASGHVSVSNYSFLGIAKIMSETEGKKLFNFL